MNQGFNLTSILPPGQTTFSTSDLDAMVETLNAAQSNPAFKVQSKSNGNVIANFAVQTISSPVALSVAPVSQDFSVTNDQLNNFTVDPKVQSALNDIGQAISQLSTGDFDANGNLNINASVLTPTLSQVGQNAQAILNSLQSFIGNASSVDANGFLASTGANSSSLLANYLQSQFGITSQSSPSLQDYVNFISTGTVVDGGKTYTLANLTSLNNATQWVGGSEGASIANGLSSGQIYPQSTDYVNTLLLGNPPSDSDLAVLGATPVASPDGNGYISGFFSLLVNTNAQSFANEGINPTDSIFQQLGDGAVGVSWSGSIIPSAIGNPSDYQRLQNAFAQHGVTYSWPSDPNSFTLGDGQNLLAAIRSANIRPALQAGDKSLAQQLGLSVPATYAQFTSALNQFAPLFTVPSSPADWTAADISRLQSALSNQQTIVQTALSSSAMAQNANGFFTALKSADPQFYASYVKDSNGKDPYQVTGTISATDVAGLQKSLTDFLTNQTNISGQASQYYGQQANSPISFNQLFSFIETQTGVDLKSAIPNLADSNGNISIGNLNSLLNLVNQSGGQSFSPLGSLLATNPLSANQLSSINTNVSTLLGQISTANTNLNSLGTLLTAFSEPANASADIIRGVYTFTTLISNIPNDVGSDTSDPSSIVAAGCIANGLPYTASSYAYTLPGILGISQPTPSNANGTYSQADVNAIYQQVTQKLSQIAPNFTPPAQATGWTQSIFSNLNGALNAQQTTLNNTINQASQQLLSPNLFAYVPTESQISLLQSQLSQLENTPAGILNTLGQKTADAINQPANQNNVSPNLAQMISSNDGGNFSTSDMSDMASSGMFIGMSNSAASDLARYSASLPGVLGIPMPTPTGANGKFSQNDINANYQLVVQKLVQIAPSFTPPASAADWTSATLSSLQNAIKAQQLASPTYQQINTLTSQIQTLQAPSLTDASGPLSIAITSPASTADSLANLISSGDVGMAVVGGEIGYTPGWYPNATSALPYSSTLAGILGIPQATPTSPGMIVWPAGTPLMGYGQSDLDNQYKLVTQALDKLVPNFIPPASFSDWTATTLSSLQTALSTQKATAIQGAKQLEKAYQTNAKNYYSQSLLSRFDSIAPTIDLTTVKTNLQNISFEDVASAVSSGEASASVTASFNQQVDTGDNPVLSPAEIDSQIAAGSLYVSSSGHFYLNRQPTTARDASVAAFVVGGNALSSKLNNLMNDVNTRNTNVQILNYLSAATSVSDLNTRLQTERTQYGYADVLSQVTGGALSDGTIPSADSDVLGTTGNFQSILKTSIDNATKNQDLDTQNLQSLTTQVQSNNTAITQLLQAYEQLLKSVAQNFE
jgi:hypothetical protein